MQDSSLHVFSSLIDIADHHRMPSVSDDAGLDIDELGQEMEMAADDSVIGNLENADSHAELAQSSSDEVEEVVDEEGEPFVEGAEVNLHGEPSGSVGMTGSVTEDGEYTSIDIGNIVIDKFGMSQSSSVDTLSDVAKIPKENSSLRQVASSASIFDESTLNDAAHDAHICSDVIANKRVGDIGCFTDGCCPLVYCTRLLCSRFLLTGFQQGLILDREVRVSVKAVALSCVGCIVTLYPRIFLDKLHKNSQGFFFL